MDHTLSRKQILWFKQFQTIKLLTISLSRQNSSLLRATIGASPTLITSPSSSHATQRPLFPTYFSIPLITIRQFIPRPPLPRLHLQLLLMLLPHPLQYPKIIQKVQYRSNDRTRRRSPQRDLSRNGEPPALLRININERRNEPRYRIQKPDPIKTISPSKHEKEFPNPPTQQLTEKSY